MVFVSRGAAAPVAPPPRAEVEGGAASSKDDLDPGIDMTPLMTAVANEDVDAVERLFRDKEKPDLYTSGRQTGHSALSFALQSPTKWKELLTSLANHYGSDFMRFDRRPRIGSTSNRSPRHRFALASLDSWIPVDKPHCLEMLQWLRRSGYYQLDMGCAYGGYYHQKDRMPDPCCLRSTLDARPIFSFSFFVHCSASCRY